MLVAYCRLCRHCRNLAAGGFVSCCDFVLRAVATFWALSLVGIYPGRASVNEVQLQKVKMAIVIAL